MPDHKMIEEWQNRFREILRGNARYAKDEIDKNASPDIYEVVASVALEGRTPHGVMYPKHVMEQLGLDPRDPLYQRALDTIRGEVAQAIARGHLVPNGSGGNSFRLTPLGIDRILSPFTLTYPAIRPDHEESDKHDKDDVTGPSPEAAHA